MGLHNQCLPLWLHRLCSGVLGTLASLMLAVTGLNRAEPGSVLHLLSVALLCGAVPIGILLAILAPRWSLIEGCAGGSGYDELDSTERRP